MGGATVLPASLLSRGSAAAPTTCASRLGINPACVARPAAGAKGTKRPGSIRDGDPPAKRCRGGASGGSSLLKPKLMSFEDREAVLKLLLSVVQPDRTPPASVVDMIEMHKTGVRDSDIEFDVHALGDAALYEIRAWLCAYKKQGALKNTVCLESPQRQHPEMVKLSVSRDNSMADLLSRASNAVRRRDIQRRRAEARRELEQMVPTAYFNDPFIDWTDVLK